MRKVLKLLFDKDLNSILNSEVIKDKNFFYLLVHYLLENKKIDLINIKEISDELEREYNFLLEDVNEEIINSMGNLIDVFKKVKLMFNEKFSDILNKLGELKDNGRNKNNAN